MKPILFSTEMVRAILDRRKTQTRRIVKPQPPADNIDSETIVERDDCMGYPAMVASWECETDFHNVKFPYGVIGDILWVRETWQKMEEGYKNIHGKPFIYQADWLEGGKGKIAHGGKWKPSIHMPKEACRLFLKIKDIRVERLHQITENDAISEGAPDTLKIDDLRVMNGMDWTIPRPFLMHQFGFMAIWCKINSPENWLQNPWVWVIEFERIPHASV
jgi:hypothetical protein